MKLYEKDPYIKEFETEVLGVDEAVQVYLKETAFYPKGGGQPTDQGIINCGGVQYNVVEVKKTENGIAHIVDKTGLSEGDRVNCELDWQRRYKLMRMHTAAHCLSSIIGKAFDAKITGNNLDMEKSRIDFNIETLDKERIEEEIDKLNTQIQEGKEVSVDYIKREEAMKDEDLFKLANVIPPNIEVLRVVTIEDIDRQCDGGTHVKNTREIGKIKLMSIENKGKQNRRLYFTVE